MRDYGVNVKPLFAISDKISRLDLEGRMFRSLSIWFCKALAQLCPSRGPHVESFVRPSLGFNSCISTNWQPATCNPVKSFVRLSLGFNCSISTNWQPVLILMILNLTVFMQWSSVPLFITSVLYTGRFPRVHWHLGANPFSSFLISMLVPLAPNMPMTSHLRSGYLKVPNCRCHCSQDSNLSVLSQFKLKSHWMCGPHYDGDIICDSERNSCWTKLL